MMQKLLKKTIKMMKNQGKNEENYEKTKGYSLEAFGASLLDEFEQQPKKISIGNYAQQKSVTHTISYSMIHREHL